MHAHMASSQKFRLTPALLENSML